jgi:hypothetical protein
MAIESKYKLEELVRGTIQICERFLGLAIRIGIWDCTLRKFSDSDQLLILQQTALSQENAHFHLNNMIAMFDTPDNNDNNNHNNNNNNNNHHNSQWNQKLSLHEFSEWLLHDCYEIIHRTTHY